MIVIISPSALSLGNCSRRCSTSCIHAVVIPSPASGRGRRGVARKGAPPPLPPPRAGPRPEGPQALAAVVEQLEGFEAAAAAWEADILPARLQHYDPEWLDSLCLSGRVLWARLTPPKPAASKDKVAAAVRSTPIALIPRPPSAPWQKLVALRQTDTLRLSPP